MINQLIAWGVGVLLLLYFAVELGWGGGKREHGRKHEGPPLW